MAETIVETRYGKVRGSEQDSITVWKGIPFARPPLGELRFRAPQPPQEWSGVRDTTRFGQIAAQPPDRMGQLLGTTNRPIPSGEDCLYLNIWSPRADNEKRPVFVWIHGGGFVTGSGSTPWYDGTAFAVQGDIVVVTLNYRLGSLGFLHLGELGGEEYATSGNCGLLDQIAALEWVRENIAAFGGDPQNVTVAGESAGGMSVASLLAMPAARGLFQHAILESGAGSGVMSQEEATKIARQFLAELKLDEKQLGALAQVPVDALLNAQQELSRKLQGTLFLRPVVDGVSLPRKPLAQVASGSAAGVALLIGTNRDEMKLFTIMDSSRSNIDEQELKQIFGASASDVLATYTQAHANATPADAWLDILTDRAFRIPAIHLAECQVQPQHAPVWMYRFDWTTPAFGGRLGACHALEIPFAWNNLDKAGVAMFTGDAPERQALADPMHAAWTAFIRTGNPNTNSLPDWPAYDTSRRATMIFNNPSQVADDPQGAERRCWDHVK